jgi:hypothetical protein
VSTEINQKINIEHVLNRAKDIANVKNDKQLAEIINTSPVHLSKKKNKGELPISFFTWAIKERLDINWLIYGESNNSEVLEEVVKKITILEKELIQKYPELKEIIQKNR